METHADCKVKMNERNLSTSHWEEDTDKVVCVNRSIMTFNIDYLLPIWIGLSAEVDLDEKV